MTSWKLRILAGVHEGIEIPLNPGQMTIGADETADDIVIQDAGIQAGHLPLTLTEEQITAHLETNGEIRIGQRLITLPAEVELPPMQLIQLSTLQFVIGPADADLSEFKAQQDNPAEAPKRKRSHSLVSLVFAVLILGCLPGALMSWLWFNSAEVESQSILTANESLQEVRNTARRMKLDDIRAQWNDHSQQVLLEGYVDTKEQKVEFLNKIDQSSINYKSELRTMTEIKDGVRFVLDNLGYHQIRVSDGDTAGTVLLTGAIDDSSRWNQVERILETDVPGLIAWKVQLQKAGAYMETLKGLLAKHQLSERVQVVEVSDRIEVRGELSETETNAFYDAASEFREVWGDRPYVVLKSMPLVASGKGFSLPLRSISIGQVPYIILTDNIKYRVGSKLPSGHRIENISEYGIDLSKGDIRLNIKLRGQQHAVLNGS